MDKKIKIAASCRRCGDLPESAVVQATDAAATEYLKLALGAVESCRPDLILLPEMCDMPGNWGMRAYVDYISERTDRVTDTVRKKARELNAWIAYPTVRQVGEGEFRNSCILFDRQGDTAMIYDKMYPTQGELEAGIGPGEELRVLDCELGRVGAAICFDLNYTQLALEYKRKKVDLLLFPSLFEGGLLKQLWAYTARAHLAGACGGCAAYVVSPAGEVTARTMGYFSELVSEINPDCALVHLDFHQEKIMALTRRYGETVKVHDPGGLGSVLLENENNSVSMEEILREFAIEPLDEYLDRMGGGGNKNV